jgi:hypothetical protein
VTYLLEFRRWLLAELAPLAFETFVALSEEGRENVIHCIHISLFRV